MSNSRPSPEDFDWRAFTPDDSPKTPLDVRADPLHEDLSTANLSVGDPAYDFSSPIFDFSSGLEQATGKHFQLLDVARQKPVALIFGSYT